MLSYLLILGTKRYMLSCLLAFCGPKCENLVKGFANSVRFVNVPRTAHRYPQVYWNPYPLLIEGLDHGQWTSLLGYLHVQIVAILFSPVWIVKPSTLS